MAKTIFFWVAKTIFYSLAALVHKILFCHLKIKFISSRHRVISSMYFAYTRMSIRVYAYVNTRVYVLLLCIPISFFIWSIVGQEEWQCNWNQQESWLLYHQIQQQLFCTQSNSCHFIVSSAISTHREVITVDSGFWNDILPKLESFYFNHLFPELVYPRIFHGEMRWNKVLEFPCLL